jgi:stress-induced morphogen
VNKEEVKARILQGFPEAEVVVNEFSGGNDHYAVLVVSDAFAGKKLLARHRSVLDLFQSEIATGEVNDETSHSGRMGNRKTKTNDVQLTEGDENERNMETKN